MSVPLACRWRCPQRKLREAGRKLFRVSHCVIASMRSYMGFVALVGCKAEALVTLLRDQDGRAGGSVSVPLACQWEWPQRKLRADGRKLFRF